MWWLFCSHWSAPLWQSQMEAGGLKWYLQPTVKGHQKQQDTLGCHWPFGPQESTDITDPPQTKPQPIAGLQTFWYWDGGIHYRQTGAGLSGCITDRLVLGRQDSLQTDWRWAVRIHYRQTGSDSLRTDWFWAVRMHYRQTGAGPSGFITDRLALGRQDSLQTDWFWFITDRQILGCQDALQTDWCWAVRIHYRRTVARLSGFITDGLLVGCQDALQTDWSWAVRIHYRQTGAGLSGYITDRLVLGHRNLLETF